MGVIGKRVEPFFAITRNQFDGLSVRVYEVTWSDTELLTHTPDCSNSPNLSTLSIPLDV